MHNPIGRNNDDHNEKKQTLRSNAGGSANCGPRLLDTYVAAEKRMRSARRERKTQSLCRSEHLFSQSPGRGDSSGFADKNQAFHSRGDCTRSATWRNGRKLSLAGRPIVHCRQVETFEDKAT